jgi:hypothetical protein
MRPASSEVGQAGATSRNRQGALAANLRGDGELRVHPGQSTLRRNRGNPCPAALRENVEGPWGGTATGSHGLAIVFLAGTATKPQETGRTGGSYARARALD